MDLDSNDQALDEGVAEPAALFQEDSQAEDNFEDDDNDVNFDQLAEGLDALQERKQELAGAPDQPPRPDSTPAGSSVEILRSEMLSSKQAFSAQVGDSLHIIEGLLGQPNRLRSPSIELSSLILDLSARADQASLESIESLTLLSAAIRSLEVSARRIQASFIDRFSEQEAERSRLVARLASLEAKMAKVSVPSTLPPPSSVSSTPSSDSKRRARENADISSCFKLSEFTNTAFRKWQLSGHTNAY